MTNTTPSHSDASTSHAANGYAAERAAVPGDQIDEKCGTGAIGAQQDGAPLATENAEDAPPVPLTSLLESLLFVADEPVEPAKLAQALQRTISEVEAALVVLRDSYEEKNRGLRLQQRGGKVQLVTNPLAAQAVEDFLNLDLTTHLSGPALEALAVIAYQQPVTRAQIEAVRGVDCSGVLRKLQQLGLIEERDRMDAPGRPILYGVTDLFLQHFGLTSMEEIPALPEVDMDALEAAIALAEGEAESG